MAKPTNVFAGLKLSDQARPPAGRTDQRLFAPRLPPPLAAPQEPAPAPEPARAGPLNVTPPPPSVAAESQPAEPAAALDLSQMPYRKHSCLLTPQEFDALDELKVAIRKKLGGTVTKENLTRCAIQYLIADVRRHGETSPVLAPLRKLVKEW